MEAFSLGRYLTVLVGTVLAGVGALAVLCWLDSGAVLIGVGVVAVGVSSFYLGQGAGTPEIGRRERS